MFSLRMLSKVTILHQSQNLIFYYLLHSVNETQTILLQKIVRMDLLRVQVLKSQSGVHFFKLKQFLDVAVWFYYPTRKNTYFIAGDQQNGLVGV